MWIVKPGENTNRGNGITVAYSLDDVIVRLKGENEITMENFELLSSKNTSRGPCYTFEESLTLGTIC